jgi:ABC-2 type transport system permease protein
MLTDELRSIYYIILKDLKAYYFKPPNISWGILFPLVLALAFSLRSPANLVDLAPGLIAMAAVFGTTSMEAIVITFERRTGALERLLLAPVSTKSILIGKILGGTVFGSMMALAMTVISIIVFKMGIKNLLLFSLSLILTLLSLSSLGALIAVSVREVFEAQTLSNYFRFPMIFLCGVFIPVTSMPQILQVVAYLLPLTYSVDALRSVTQGTLSSLNILIDVFILGLYTLAFSYTSDIILRRSLR